MLDFSGSATVYLACGVTDLRKSYTGLAAIIKLKFHLDPYEYSGRFYTSIPEIGNRRSDVKETALPF